MSRSKNNTPKRKMKPYATTLVFTKIMHGMTEEIMARQKKLRPPQLTGLSKKENVNLTKKKSKKD